MGSTGRKFENYKIIGGNGAKLDIVDDEGFTPLYIAASEGYPQIVEYFISKNVDVNSTNKKLEYSTPLDIACVYNKIDVVEILLKNKANAEAKDSDGRTPLFNAALNENIEVIKLLLRYGADVNTKDKRGKMIKDVKKPKIKKEVFQLLYK